MFTADGAWRHKCFQVERRYFRKYIRHFPGHAEARVSCVGSEEIVYVGFMGADLAQSQCLSWNIFSREISVNPISLECIIVNHTHSACVLGGRDG